MPSHLRALLVLAVAVKCGGSVFADDKTPEPGEEIELDLGTDVKLRLCWVPAGKFTMGSPKNEAGRERDESEHEVEISGFWMGKYHVTQRQYVKTSGKANPSYYCSTGDGKNRVLGINTDDFPVEWVSWEEARKWTEDLNRKIADGKVKVPARWKSWELSLPSEAQWEYAVRGGRGNGQAYYWGNEANGKQANCYGGFPYGTNTKGPYIKRTTKVGSYEKVAPHPWGLCDMSGNVWQWCLDIYDPYENAPKKKDPVQLTGLAEHGVVMRGGSWEENPWNCRSASRDWIGKMGHREDIGFRVCFRLD